MPPPDLVAEPELVFSDGSAEAGTLVLIIGIGRYGRKPARRKETAAMHGNVVGSSM